MTDGRSERAAEGATVGRTGVCEVLLIEAFTARDLPRLRQLSYQEMVASGLVEFRALAFAFAINIGLVNAVRHGGGRGVLRIVRDSRKQLIAEVVDEGGRVIRPAPAWPMTGEVRAGLLGLAPGRGLWLAQRLVDGLELRSEPAGTTLRLTMASSDADTYPWAGSPYDARLADLMAAVLFPAPADS